MSVTDLSSFSSSLKFTPVEPGLKGLLHTYVTDPNKIQPEGILVYFFYEDPSYGRIVVMEMLNAIDQSAFEGLLVYNDEPTSKVVFSIVALHDGTEALVEILKTPSEDGLSPNSVRFLAGDADITIYGPDGTFTEDKAIPVANLVLGE